MASPLVTPIVSHVQPQSVPLQRLQVLVVESQPAVQEWLGEILLQNGASLTLTTSSAQALQALNDSVPDLVMISLELIEAEGTTLLTTLQRRQRQQPQRIPAIALFSPHQRITPNQAMQMGFDWAIQHFLNAPSVLTMIQGLSNPSRSVA